MKEKRLFLLIVKAFGARSEKKCTIARLDIIQPFLLSKYVHIHVLLHDEQYVICMCANLF